MTRCLRVSRVVLIAGLWLSLAPWTFPAGSHSLKRSYSNLCLKTNRVRNSQEGTTQPQHVTPPAVVIVLAPEVRPGGLLERFPQGSRLARLDPTEAAPECLTSGFFAAADPRTSFDGARVLFAGKKTADSPWQIWEMNVDGSGARQVTHCPGDCLKPAYLPARRNRLHGVSRRPRRAPEAASVATADVHRQPDSARRARRNLPALGQQTGWI